MIIVRSPLRITLGGGGTDLPSYYRRFGGFCISAAIDKYVYITLHENFRPEIILKYSEMEKVEDWDGIQNPIIKEALHYMGLESSHLEICSMSDIPGNTGLGGSSAFACALLKALYAYQKKDAHASFLACGACSIEKSNPGVGDQHASAYGGLRAFQFNTDEKLLSVEENHLNISDETLANLEENLLLIFTGFSRDSASILSEQDKLIQQDYKEMIANLHLMKSIGLRAQHELEAGNLIGFAETMNDHWKVKCDRSPLITNNYIDMRYELGMKNGAIGGKLVGAGGGGFLLFYCSDKPKCRHAMTAAGLREVRFRFDFEGTKVLNL